MTAIPPTVIETDPVRINLWEDFAGIDLVSVPPAVGLNMASSSNGIRIDDAGRPTHTEAFISDSSLASSAVGVSLYVLHTPDGTYKLIAATTTGFQIKNPGASWVALTGTALVGVGRDDRFSFIRWGKYVLASNNVVGLYKLDLDAYTFTQIEDAPQGICHLAALTNRVIGTRPVNFPGRVTWSAQLDSDDWSSLGSGFEDFLDRAGDEADMPHSTWPINENESIILCERGLYLMSATDNFDAPFRFSRIQGGEGSPSPFTAARVPGGIIYAGWTDFFFASRDGVESLGRPFIANTVFSTSGNYGIRRWLAFGLYIPNNNEYVCNYTSSGGSGIQLRYNISRKAWTIGGSLGGIPVVYAAGVYTTPYNNMSGSYDSQTGSLIDELGNAGNVPDWALYTFADLTSNSILRAAATSVNTSGVLASGDVEIEQPDNQITIQYVSLVYSTGDTQKYSIRLDYSLDGSAWQTLGSFDTVPRLTSDAIDVVRVGTIDKVLTGHYVRFRVWIASMPNRFKIIKLSVYGTKNPTARNG